MEKLIELLDKFRRENKTKELVGEPGTLVPLTGKDFIELNRVIIISKEYGFIKWLVENDKITDGTCMLQIIISDLEKYECVLMQLAISDNPIQDLIDLLK